MIKLTETIWIGNSNDERHSDLESIGIKNVLNVAYDLDGTRGRESGVEYAQVGLIDGPGNPPAAYHAAILTLNVLLQRGTTLVFCHDGSRSLALVMMYLNVHAKLTWEKWLRLLLERIEANLPEPNSAHKEAFNELNWKALADIIKAQ